MKRYFLILIPCLFVALQAKAGWQVAKPQTAIPRDPFFQAGVEKKHGVPPAAPTAYGSAPFPNQYSKLGKPTPIYAVSICGSLKENLERIMGRYHWKVVWKVPYDYNFDGRITGSSLPNVVNKLLQPFPLQAIMYMSNRTLTVVSKNKTGI